MADKRMFAKTIVDSDNFLEMPMSARLLYYDLGMRADDDGFVNSPKKIMRIIGASTDDMNILIARKFIIPFDSGIVVIRHWRINNYLRSDRYTETTYTEEKSHLAMDDNKQYLSEYEAETLGIPLGLPMIGSEKNKEEETKAKKKETEKLKEQEYEKLFETLWAMYIRKEGKSGVNKKAKKEIYSIGYERMAKCIEKYNNKVKDNDTKYQLMGSTFFNGRFRDYLDEEPAVLNQKAVDPNEGLDKVVELPDEPTQEEENAWASDKARHPFAEGWRINDDGYWINIKH